MAGDAPLWAPTKDQVDAAPMTAFMQAAAAATGKVFSSYAELHRWSIDDREAFWSLVWNFCGIVGDKGAGGGERVLVDGEKMPGAAFFPDAKLNFAENLLKKTGLGDAIVFRGEDKVERRLSWNELHALTSRLQQLFLSLGVKKGDRIAAMMPNMPETVAAMLATASIGAVWSSCSPDFGEQGVLDRFGQIEPVVFIVPDGYWYNGKAIEVADKIAAVAAKLVTVRKILIVDYLGTSTDVAATIEKATALDEALSSFATKPVTFARLP
ncbi:acetoacetate--CoA ligase, partial [Mesorhizobium sp. M5C.F.Ca.IN.020.29.1.1]